MPQDLYNLPEGWEWAQLKDVVRNTSNLSPISEPDKTWTYIDISSVDRDIYKITEPKLIKGKSAPSRAKKHIQENDILFATTRPNLKNIAIFEGDSDNPIASTGFCILRSSERLNHRYLFYFLITEDLQSQIAPFISGASYPAITDSNLKKVQIPLPPLSEQERIVEKLNAIFRRIDAATARLNQILTHSQALFASALDQVFSSADWEPRPLKELCAFENGDRGKNYPSRAAFVDEGIPVINAGALTDQGIDKSALNFITRERFNILGGGKVRPGDILFCLRGSLGKSSIVEDIQEGAIASSLVIVRPSDELLNREFLQYYFRSSTCEKFIHQYDNGAAQPNLSSCSLQKFEIPLPPLEEQQRIVEHLDGLSARIQTLEKTTRARIAHLAALKASLLAAAFRGEL